MMLNTARRAAPAHEISAVRKALALLSAFAETPRASVSDLSRRLDLPKSTAHNLLRTLAASGFVVQDPQTRLFRLGPRIFELGLQFSATTQLAAAALPHLRRLVQTTKETVKLGMLSDGDVLVLSAVESPYELHTRGDAGRRAPLHSTGLGKALLAALPPEEVREIVARKGLARATPRTIASAAQLEAELGRVREAGYAFDREESEPGVQCVATALPRTAGFGLAALSISGPSMRVTARRAGELGRLAMEAAAAIAADLRVTAD